MSNAGSDELPEGWTLTTLGSVVNASPEKVEPASVGEVAYIGLEHIEAHTNRILGRGRASDVRSTKGVFRAGDVLYGKLRPYLNKVCAPEFDGVCSTDIIVLPRSGAIESKLLMWFLSQKRVADEAHERSAGTQLPRVNFLALAELSLALPPLAEQRRIVGAVDALLAQVTAARVRLVAAQRVIARFRQAVLAAACAGRLTEDWRDSHPREVAPTVRRRTALAPTRRGANASAANVLLADDMPELPPTWRYERLDHLAADDTVVTYGIVLPGPEVDGGVPYVRQQDVEDGRIRLGELRHTTPEIAARHTRSQLQPGDVLLCIIRNLRVALVPPELDGANITQGAVRIRPHAQLVRGPYLGYFLRTPAAQAWMRERYFGIDMPRINVEDARAVPVALPSLSEQDEIVRRVDQAFALADAVDRRLTAALARADRLPQAVLARAFAGQLVPTEAELARAEGRAYEPADVLLRRVAVQRPPVATKRRGRAASGAAAA